jgi:outer membrane receptor protein involved in Fe transport
VTSRFAARSADPDEPSTTRGNPPNPSPQGVMIVMVPGNGAVQYSLSRLRFSLNEVREESSRVKIVAAVVAFALCTSTVPARADDDALRIAETMTVEAEEMKAMEERKESAVDRTIITHREMEELGGQTAADVLRRLPRLYFSGPPATNKDVRMAGLDKEFQGVLINGNRPPGGGEKREFSLDRIPVEQIERIEIIENTTAAYDSDAVGGLINIILKKAPDGRSLQVSLGGSRSGADEPGNRASFEYGGLFGQVGARLGATRGDDSRVNEKTIADAGKGEGEGESETVQTILTSINGVLSSPIGSRDVVTFRPFISEQGERKVKGRLISALASGTPKSRNDEDEDKTSTLETYGLEWIHAFDRGISLSLQGNYQVHDEAKDKTTAQFTGSELKFSKTILETEEKEDAETVATADLRVPLEGPGKTVHLLSAGVKFRDRERTVAKELREVNPAGVVKVTTNPNDSYIVEEAINAVYLMDEAALTQRFVITPGVRIESSSGRYATTGDREDSDAAVDWNPSVHARYRFASEVQLRAAISRTLSRPPFKDKVPTRSVKADKIEEGNPDLSVATSVNVDVGIEKHFGKSGLLALGAFWKGIDDVIERQQTGIDAVTGLPVVRPINAGAATVQGIELEGRGDLSALGLPQLTLIGNTTWLTSEVKDVNTGEYRRLVDQPRSLANLVARYDLRRVGLTFSVGVNYVGEKVNASDPVKGVKSETPFRQWDASLTKTIANRFSIFASGVNLTNEKREKEQGSRLELEAPGRTFFFGVRYSL